MKNALIFTTLLLTLPMASFAHATTPKAMNYDCSKPGNANKTACKAAKPAAPAVPVLAAATKPAAKPMNYDCSKAGNANKAACKSASPAPVAVAVNAKPQKNYDCSKAGNANKAVCKGATPVFAEAVNKPAAAVVAANPVPTVAATPQPASVAMAAPAAAVNVAKTAAATAPVVAGQPRIVEWKTKTGKIVHYDCSKAGNLNKQACKV